MELYSMPQLDKTSPVYSGAQYEGGGEDIASRRTSSSDVKKYGTVASDTLPLLTSSAWSAVIHRPADEDSEPDDLPSTVDMDAIKGSPATTLNAPKPQLNTVDPDWTQEKEEDGKLEISKEAEEAGASDSEDSEGDESDSQDSDGDGDSGDTETANGSVSDSEGSESGSCSWSDSDSDSGSSSCSSGSGCSSGRSSHTHQNFTIRETNFEQGNSGCVKVLQAPGWNVMTIFQDIDNMRIVKAKLKQETKSKEVAEEPQETREDEDDDSEPEYGSRLY